MDIRGIIEFIDRAEMSFYLVEKKSRKNKRPTYAVYTPNISEIKQDIVSMFRNHIIENPIYQNEQVQFDTVVAEDDRLEFCIAGSTPHDAIEGLIENSIENRGNHIDFSAPNVDINKLSFYCTKFEIDGEEPLYLIRRVNKLSALNRGFKALFSDNSFSKLNDQVFAIDPMNDLIIQNEEALILSRFALNVLCTIDDFYIDATKQLLESVKSHFSNYDAFLEDCLQNRRILRKMVKMSENPERISLVLDEGRAAIESVIEDHALTVTLDEGGLINYSGDATEMTEIANLLSDAYFRSSILNEKGISR